MLTASRRTTARLLAGVGAATLVLVTGCGGGAGSGGSRAEQKPAEKTEAGGGAGGGDSKSPEATCKLLEPPDVSAVVGLPVEATEARVTDAHDECLWTLEQTGPGQNVVSLRRLTLRPADQFSGAKTGEAVSGIGDEAYWDGATSALAFRSGSDYYIVQVLVDDRPEDVQLESPSDPELTARQKEWATSLAGKVA